ncbi:hypothetical protein TorRG33x02_357360 [Trema orientale]|uniref:Uncharacterized protein n=1 Tax=Trema orientale TaxID=63057 RepID=A0A2P5A5C6_TREOI|nr:hypothetical protein TorRG33x02_357360 [Trema orientale]
MVGQPFFPGESGVDQLVEIIKSFRSKIGLERRQNLLLCPGSRSTVLMVLLLAHQVLLGVQGCFRLINDLFVDVSLSLWELVTLLRQNWKRQFMRLILLGNMDGSISS